MFFRDTWIEINLDAIASNVLGLKKHYVKDKRLIAVIKADAYGHGAIETARCLIQTGIDHLAVATLDEAIELRIHQIDVPILVLGNVPVDYLELAVKYNVAITAHSLTWLRQALKQKLPGNLMVHLKLDTGMHRIGLTSHEELVEAIRLLNEASLFQLCGVYTHLATADDRDDTYYKMQLNRFKAYLEVIEDRDLLIHMANSAATVKYTDELTNAVRVGLLLYGISPKSDLPITFSLKPALNLYTRIIQCKKVGRGKKISYNGVYEATEEEWIGTIPIGYADGLDRRYQGGMVYVDGVYCPIVGHICMDQSMIRLPHPVSEGTLVEVIGPHIPVELMAARCGTIPYQQLTQLSKRLPRIYKRKKQMIRIQNDILKDKDEN